MSRALLTLLLAVLADPPAHACPGQWLPWAYVSWSVRRSPAILARFKTQADCELFRRVADGGARDSFCGEVP